MPTNEPTEAPKRRLPMFKEPPPPSGEDDDASDEGDAKERPAWHWAAFGVVIVFIVWLPLAALAHGAVTAHLGAQADQLDLPAGAEAWLVAVHALALGLAAFGGGLFVGRMGATTGKKEATASGGFAVLIAWTIGAYGAPTNAVPVLALLLLLLLALGAGFGLLGGVVGIQWRTRRAR